MVRDQALLLTRQGHEVLVMSGSGQDPEEGYAFALVPELAADHPLNVSVRSVLDNGQSDQNFSKYRSLLVAALAPYLSQVEVTLVHNIFTMHFNLALTQALHDLAAQHKLVAWTHDLIATNHDYALPNPTKPPWNLVRQSVPGVAYVAVSEKRAEEIKANLQPAPEVQVIPDGIDLGRFFDLSLEMRESLEALALPERDYIFLLPSALMLRKNVEFGIELAKELLGKGLNPMVLITGAPDRNSTAAAQYGKFLKETLPAPLLNHVVFIHDHFVVTEPIMRDLYHVSDCLLYPSRQEGFGLPILEAALHRMPIFCGDVPAYRESGGDGAFLLNDVTKINDAIAWLENQPTFKLRRLVRSKFDLDALYRRHYTKLLNI